MLKLSVLIPGLLGPLAELQEVNLALPEFKILSQYLSRGQVIKHLPQGYLATLAYLLGCSQPLSTAKISAAQDKVLLADHFFLRADPVHFKTEMDHAVLLDQHRLGIVKEEADALIDSFNQHFREDGLQLHCSESSRWYLQFPKSLDIQTTPLTQAIARNVHNFLPQGKDAQHWRRLLNEAQMLFHSHEVNQRRESAGQLSINSVWLWDEVILPDQPQKNTPLDWIMSDEVLACGLAQKNQLEVQPLQTDFSGLSGHGLLVLNDIAAPVSYGDVNAWLIAVNEMTRQWLEPMHQMLKQKQLSEINFYTADGQGFKINHLDLFKFWQNKHWGQFIR